MQKMARKAGNFVMCSSKRTSLLLQCRASPYFMKTTTRGLRFSANNFRENFSDSKLKPLAAVSEWLKKCWDSDKSLPAFAVNGDRITVLTQPQDFYRTLKAKAAKAEKRIVLASLYLGTGKLEQDLVDTMYERTKEMKDLKKDNFKIRILLDHPRASRGRKSSKTMLLPLVKDFSSSVKVCLYHPPKLRGILYKVIPERFNETISAMHIKAYIFDDTLVMSGANLSNDYFTNRQDRCIVFEDCKELCDYFDDLVQTVSSFSLELQPDCTTSVSVDCPEHPYKGSKKTYIEAVKAKLQEFIERYHQLRKLDSFLSSHDDQCHQVDNGKLLKPVDKSEEGVPSDQNYGQEDTWIVPTLQMFYYNLRQDEMFTSRFLESAPAASDIFLATAYFNVTAKHWDEVLSTKSKNFDIVMAHPLANGFYKAPGPAGGIPHAYTLIAKQCFKDIMRFKQQDRIRFWEYQRLGWTFHGKGLWAKLHEAAQPLITMIGSSNFGNRSVYRDLEAQLTIITTNEQLSNQLNEEKRNFLEYSDKVGVKTYKDPERKVPFWVFVIRTFMRTFF